ncbi:MAG: hypothetical protein PHU08_02815 [Dehalococcoidales bacterium]|nr:hypothetical protein [Dehalococcoidales bacterium]
MSIAGLILGICSFMGMLIALIPFLGWMNWLNIPVAVIGLILSVLGTASRKQRGAGITGIILCSAAVLLGLFRLTLGGGIL